MPATHQSDLPGRVSLPKRLPPTVLPCDLLASLSLRGRARVTCSPRHDERVLTVQCHGTGATVAFHACMGAQHRMGVRLVTLERITGTESYRLAAEQFVAMPETTQSRKGMPI